MRSIVLIGFMGAGKTEVGGALAALTGLDFVDTDALVEAAAGKSVEQIFAESNEAGFRARETDAVTQAVSGSGRVIACGGGAVLALKNYQALQSAGPIVYLRAPADALRARTGSGAGRPLLSSPDAFDRLLAERAPAYEAAADLIVDTGGRTPEDVAAEIVALLAR
ncbi:MAG: shikimate kinase [Actinobacteria bacterium]|nr:shikimate kinase [Actinomycetota bacterium]